MSSPGGVGLQRILKSSWAEPPQACMAPLGDLEGHPLSRHMQPGTKSSHLLSGMLAGPQLLSPQLGAFLWDHRLAGEKTKVTVNNQEEKSVNKFTFLNLCTNQSDHAQKDPRTSVPLARNSGKAGLEAPI